MKEKEYKTEINNLQNLKCPNIIKIIDHFCEN